MVFHLPLTIFQSRCQTLISYMLISILNILFGIQPFQLHLRTDEYRVSPIPMYNPYLYEPCLVSIRIHSCGHRAAKRERWSGEETRVKQVVGKGPHWSGGKCLKKLNIFPAKKCECVWLLAISYRSDRDVWWYFFVFVLFFSANFYITLNLVCGIRYDKEPSWLSEFNSLFLWKNVINLFV